jgi:group I intron endonuclease
MIGIYEIVNIVNNKRYIGSSINIRNRKNAHYNTLRKNKHPNPHLQKAFNKYGESNFCFNVLEDMGEDADELSVRLQEQEYISNHDWDTLYNSQKFVLESYLKEQKYCNINQWIQYRKERGTYRIYAKNSSRLFTFDTLKQAQKFREENWEKLEGTVPFEDYSKEEHYNKVSIKNRKSGGNVHFNKKSGSWIATIVIERKTCHLGCYPTKEEATRIRLEAEEKYYNQGIPWTEEEAKKYKYVAPKFDPNAKGVSFHKPTGKWAARMSKVYIGLFETEDAALEARQNYIDSGFSKTALKRAPPPENVYYGKAVGKWIARHNNMHIGCFDSKEEAATSLSNYKKLKVDLDTNNPLTETVLIRTYKDRIGTSKQTRVSLGEFLKLLPITLPRQFVLKTIEKSQSLKVFKKISSNQLFVTLTDGSGL